MKRDWFRSFNDAAAGLIRTTKSQRNLRYHLLFAFLAVTLSLFLNITRMEFVLITLAIGMVITAELFNSAVEDVVDLVSENYHPMAKRAKDVAAAAVLVAAGVAVVCGYLVLVPRMEKPVLSVVGYVEKGPEYVTAISLVVVVLAVIAGKASLGRGQVLRGGMPSGHAAVSFSAATAITFLTHNFLVMVLSFFMAVLVAQSRMIFRIHTLKEVAAGAAAGVIVTILVFQLIR